MSENPTTEKKMFLLPLLGMALYCISIFMALYSTGISKIETPYFSYMVIVIFFSGLFLYLGQEKKERSIKGGKFLILFFVIYSLWLFVEPHTSTWFDKSRLSAWILFLTPISFFIASFIKLNKYQLKVVFISYFSTGAFLFCWSILDFIVMRRRPDGPTHDANVFAGLLLFFIIPLTVFWLIKKFDTKKEKRQSDFILLYLCFGYLGFFAPYSRSATGALVIVGLLLLAKVYKDGFGISLKRKILPVLFIIVSSFALINWFANFSPMTRDVSQDRPSQLRLGLWKTGLEIYKDNNKLTGIGFGQFSEFYARNRPTSDKSTSGFYAHNDYVQFLVEGGLIQLLFFTVLSIYIIYNYLRLFLHKSKNNQEYLLGFVALSICCVYFIQANVNFIFYVAPNAILIGILLACLNRLGVPKKSEIVITGRKGFGILVFSTLSLIMFLLNIYINLYFYFLSSNLSEDKYRSLFKQSQFLSKINPRTLSLPHFNLKYQLIQIANNDYSGDLNQALTYVDNELDRAIKNKKYDADTVKFLAKYKFDNPDVFQALIKRFPEQRLYTLTPEELYLLSIEYNPLIFGSYLSLREIYIKEGNRLKAYELLRDGIVDSPNYKVFIGHFQAKSIVMVLNDAVELGLQDEAEGYAIRILEDFPCHKAALKAIDKKIPTECKK